MRSLCIAVDRLAYPFAEHIRASQNMNTAIRSLQNVQYSLYGTNYPLSMKAAGLMNEALRLKNSLDALNHYVVQSADIYRSLEMRLTKSAGLINGKKPSTDDFNDLTNRVEDAFALWKKQLEWLKPSQTGKSEAVNRAEWYAEFFDGYYETIASGFRPGSIFSLLSEGIKYRLEGALHLAHVGVKKHYNANLHASAEVGVGNAEVSGKVKGVIFDDDGLNPTLKAEGDVTVSAIQAKVIGVLKNDFIKNTLTLQGDVGVASASGKAVISKDEITVKGEVKASAARASAENTFEFLGLKFSLGASAEVGIGVGGGFSSTSNSFEMGASLSLIAGLGANIKIEW